MLSESKFGKRGSAIAGFNSNSLQGTSHAQFHLPAALEVIRIFRVLSIPTIKLFNLFIFNLFKFSYSAKQWWDFNYSNLSKREWFWKIAEYGPVNCSLLDR